MFKRGDLSTLKEIKVSRTGLIRIPKGKQLILEGYFRSQLEYQSKPKKVQEYVPEIKERLFEIRRWGKKAQMKYRFLTGERVFGRPIEESYKSKLRYRDKLFEVREKESLSMNYFDFKFNIYPPLYFGLHKGYKLEDYHYLKNLQPNLNQKKKFFYLKRHILLKNLE